MKRFPPKDAATDSEGLYPPQFASETIAMGSSPHRIELEVQRELLSDPRLSFSSLVVRRMGNAVCLQGVLHTDGDSSDVCSIAQRVAGVERVLNHLVVASRFEVPRKG